MAGAHSLEFSNCARTAMAVVFAVAFLVGYLCLAEKEETKIESCFL